MGGSGVDVSPGEGGVDDPSQHLGVGDARKLGCCLQPDETLDAQGDRDPATHLGATGATRFGGHQPDSMSASVLAAVTAHASASAVTLEQSGMSATNAPVPPPWLRASVR